MRGTDCTGSLVSVDASSGAEIVVVVEEMTVYLDIGSVERKTR
jgi:hypothetical protein